MSARVGISLIGTPDGFESVSIGVPKSLNLGRKVDLDNSVISILPETDILVVRRDIEDNRLLTFITYYRFAKEIKTSRTGSFYGGSLLFENFVPNKFKNIYNVLESLADTVKNSCIDPAENRFHSHLRQTWLEDMKAAAPGLLDVSTYQGKQPELDQNVSNRRCFLLLDEDVPDYIKFLSKVLQRDRRTKLNLSSYQFVYTSKHEDIIKGVRSRQGLEIETLSSLKAKAPKEKRSQKEQQNSSSLEYDDGAFPANQSQTEISTDESVNDFAENGVEPWGRSFTDAAYQQFLLSSEASRTDGARTDRVSRIEIQVPIRRPPDERERNQGASDETRLPVPGRFEQISTWLRANRSPVTNRNILLAIALIFVIAGYMILSPVIRDALSYLLGTSKRFPEDTIYYTGCLKSKSSENDLADSRTRCTPEYVAEQFLIQLRRCETYNTQMRKFDDERTKDEYNQSIKEQIKDSIADSEFGNKRSGKFDKSPLSETESTKFKVELKFDQSAQCLQMILDAESSDFLKTAPPTDRPTQIVNTNPSTNTKTTNNKTSNTNPRNPTPSPTRATAASPTRPPRPTPSRTTTPPAGAGAPVLLNPDEDPPPPPVVKPKSTPTPQVNSNKTRSAASVATDRRSQLKKGVKRTP
jgi:hypothetical protein